MKEAYGKLLKNGTAEPEDAESKEMQATTKDTPTDNPDEVSDDDEKAINDEIEKNLETERKIEKKLVVSHFASKIVNMTSFKILPPGNVKKP